MPSNKQLPAATQAAAPINWAGWSDKLAELKPAEAAAQIANAITLLERGALQVGEALKALHDRFAGKRAGLFEKTLEDVGLSPNTARRYMLIAERFGAYKDANLPLLTIGVSKLALLAKSLTDEEARELVEAGSVAGLNYDGINKKSVKQLELDLRERKPEAEIALENKVRQNLSSYQKERNAHQKTKAELAEVKKQRANEAREPWRALPPELLTALNNADAALALVIQTIAEAEKAGAPAQAAMADQCADALKNFRNKTLNKALGEAAAKIERWAKNS